METNALQEINDNEPIEGLPDALEISDADIGQLWSGIPRRAAQILALHKLGFTSTDLAKGYGVSTATIAEYKRKYDPDGKLPLAANIGKQLAAHAFQRTALRALAHVDTDKLESASAAALMTVAGIAQDKALRIKESIDADKLQADVSGLASALRQYVTPPQAAEQLDP